MVISAAQGLALTRIGFGLYFLAQAMAKTPAWLSDGGPLGQQLQNQLPRSEAFYRPFLEGAVLPNVTLFAQLVTIGEWVAGLSLVLGLLTRLGALIGIWLTLNYMLMKGLPSLAGSSDRLFILACLVFVLASAGLVWGLDGRLRESLAGNPVTRWLAGIGEERPSLVPAR
jgi:uncharacterized membrane protein YphA (DoxX/SURF4 family)